MKKISLCVVSLLFAVAAVYGQPRPEGDLIDRLLDRPLRFTQVDGDTFLQRDLTDYLALTLGEAGEPAGMESDDLHARETLKAYFMRPHPSVATMEKYFHAAAAEFGVPAPILMAVGQVESNWAQVGPSIDQGWGVMHLVQNGYANTLGEAAALTGVSEQELKDDALQNIRGAAALIAKYAGPERTDFVEFADWLPALGKFSGLATEELQARQASQYLDTLQEGVTARTIWGETVVVKAMETGHKSLRPVALSADYSPALSNSAASCNYGSGRNHSIDTWVNHWIGSGTYLGTISWFQTCPGSGPGQRGYIPGTTTLFGASSAHFVIKSSNGEITQMVAVSNTAYHAGVSGYPYNNGRSIGVEHEATSANPGLWNSAAMLNASATMARHFKNQYGFPTTQNASPGIAGHNDMPGTNTQCPGSLPWSTWMSYFNAGGGTAPQNDQCSGATTLTSNSSCSFTAGSVLNATASGRPKPSCDGFGSPNMFDVWYRFTATGSTHTITVDPTTSVGDPVVAVYSSCSGSPLACADTSPGNTETVSVSGLSAGTTYYVRVYDYGAVEPTGSDAQFQICVTGSAADTARPVVTNFTVSPATIVAGSSITATITATDSGGSGLDRIELWRTTDSNGAPAANGWAEVTRTSVSGNGPLSRSLTDSPAAGTFWYGVHVVDEAGNWATEPAAIRVVVNGAAASVTTNSATAVTTAGATLNGTVNPNGATATTGFEYGASTSYGASVAAQTVSGAGSQSISAGIGGLACGTVYHFRARATANGSTTYGSDRTFPTVSCAPSSPVVTTSSPSSITQSAATLHATVNPNGSSTTTLFEYGPTTSYGSTATGPVLNGTGGQAVSVAVAGLACGSTYHFRAAATNSGGTTFGTDVPFATATCTTSVRRPDADGDSKADLIWRDVGSGRTALWFMNGINPPRGAWLPDLPSPWVAGGFADTDNDGKADLVWRNPVTGENAIWLLDGGSVRGFYLPHVNPPWEIEGMGDTNGDGKADVLWRNPSTGQNAIWLMDGSTLVTGTYLPSVSSPWEIAGIGDSDGDAKADVLWRNPSTGATAIWLMDGSTLRLGAYLPSPETTWFIRGFGDVNGDMKADVIWRNTNTGENAVWFLAGASIGSTAYLPTVTGSLDIKSVADFSGDGKVDVFWRDGATGVNALWIMNGSGITLSAYLPSVETGMIVVAPK